MFYTYDRSTGLSLALVADDKLGGARYIPISEASSELRTLAAPYLRQLHTVANLTPTGLTAHPRMQLDPKEWEVLGK